MEELVFFDWFSRQFPPAIQSIKRYVLIYDGHYTHISARIVKTAVDNGAQSECLPPRTGIILQLPNSVTLTKVKTSERQFSRKHYLRTSSAVIDKMKFALLVRAINCF